MEQDVIAAFQAWLTRKAYIDGRGNYHIRQAGPSGPIAPWNKTIKRTFATVTDFHRAAHQWQDTTKAV
jgi:hypothetical protein